MENKFHKGERYIHEMLGEVAIADTIGRGLSKTIKGLGVRFIEDQTMVVLSSLDKSDQIWTSILFGGKGLVKVPDSGTLIFNLEFLKSTTEDIFFDNVKEGARLGCLFIDLFTRKRFRVNGTCLSVGRSIIVDVEEAYPNCPKYIQRRTFEITQSSDKLAVTSVRGDALGEYERELIAQSDTFFVGSSSKAGLMDASHRGGNPGFVQVLENDMLKIPDYQGNHMYNTLGNIVTNPNVGLLFHDFHSNVVLQLTGKGKLDFDHDSQEDQELTTGTGRYWLFTPERWIRTEHPHPVNWSYVDSSPFNPKKT